MDDFAIAAETQEQCNATFAQIGQYLRVPLNQLGIITKFNGVNILQTRWYIKVSCENYLRKILESHNWLDLPTFNLPVPMLSNLAYQQELEQAIRPTTETEQQAIQAQAAFIYRMAIEELIYALVVTRLEISFATTKVSQYSSNPALIHYTAVKQVFAYLKETITDGLIFWRPRPATPTI